MSKKHVLSVLVTDQPGVLQRVASLFSRRNFNIDSITVGSTEKPGFSRMVITTIGDEQTIEQVKKQLAKLVNVIEVVDLTANPMVARSLALIKVKAEPERRPEILGLVDTFRASVVDISPENMIIQAVGNEEKIEAIIELLRPYGVVEITHTGITAMLRG
mgnify:CR=1 FL=1